MKIALIGIGKIAQDQHVPAIAASSDWDLTATVSRQGRVDGVPAFTDLATMLDAYPQVDTVSLCLPPVPRFEMAQAALRAGRHVMLEKPPGATLAEVHALSALAAQQDRSLYATWHSRHADKVTAAKAHLSTRQVIRAHIDWREDVRRWHPGQDWVFEPGGMGVFDPGINALSILTEILPTPVHLSAATLDVPANRQTPIAADLWFTGGVTAQLDWRKTGDQIWSIRVETDTSVLELHQGGARMIIDGVESPASDNAPMGGEYPRLYAEMARLVRAGQSEVDLTPMIHVADAFTLGQRREVAPFEF